MNKIKYYMLGLLLIFLFSPKIFSQAREIELKAAYMERIIRYVEWPASETINDSSKAFIINVLGNNPLGNILEKVFYKRKILSKKVVINYIDNSEDFGECDLLFISSSKSGSLENILSRVKRKPILTFSDSRDFAEKGVMINLFVEGEKLTYVVNEKAYQDAGFNISSHLLRYAKIVNRKK